MKYKIIIDDDQKKLSVYQEVSKVSVTKLFMIESIDDVNRRIILANYVFNKRYKVAVSSEELEVYTEAFDDALSRNMFLSVEYDEKRGVIIGE